MLAEAALDFVAQNHRGVLATYRRDGGAQMSPILVAPGHDGSLLVSTREAAVKTANLRRNPRYDLLAFSDQFFGPWISVTGTAEVISQPEAMSWLEEYYRAAVGEHPDWADYRRAMERERRVVLHLDIGSVGPDRQG